jgi:hypothetical protein
MARGLRHTPEGGALFDITWPQDWPGVHCVNALLTGQPLKGTWFDRTQEFAARNRGESFGPRKYSLPEVLELDPLPCWRHLSEKQYQSRMAGLVERSPVEAAARRKEPAASPSVQPRSWLSIRSANR